MYWLFYTPQWFNGWDISFDLVGLLVTFLIAAYSWRIYGLNRENKFKYLSLAFLLVSLSLLVKAFSSSVLYYGGVREVIVTALGPAVGPELRFSEILYRSAFFAQMVTTLGAWLLIFFISQKSRARLNKLYEVSQIGLFVYLIVLISVVANFQYVVFYLTSVVLLALIVLNYYKNYLNTDGNSNAWRVLTSFMLIFFGNILFIFVSLWDTLYVFGEVFTLGGYLLLLWTYHSIVSR